MFRLQFGKCFGGPIVEVLRQKAKELNKKGFSIVSANDVQGLRGSRGWHGMDDVAGKDWEKQKIPKPLGKTTNTRDRSK